MSGITEKLGDLSWIGPTYSDQGWVELSEAEELAITSTRIMAKAEKEREYANQVLSNPSITVGEKIAWNEYLLALDRVCICSDHDCNPVFPVRPDA